MPDFNIELLKPYHFLLEPAPFKGLYGGRGGGKSFGATDAILLDCFRDRHRVACLRETQASMKESMHALIVDRIGEHGMGDYFKVTENSIKNKYTGSDFFFKGLKTSPREIKSTHGITRALVEEAEGVTDKSWEILLPTVRGPGAEIWAIWNPEEENNATDKLWRKNPPSGAIVKQISWRDNPFFPPNLEKQRSDMLRADPVLYEHIWEGGYRKIGKACIFGDRVTIHDFVMPEHQERIYFGGDWGFAKDPTVLIRFYITRNEDKSEELWIEYEAFGYEVELDDIPALFDTVPGARKWPIKADCARPETISYVRRRGFNIEGAKKWSGSVEDGIAHIKGFKAIHIHTRCENIAKEARLYSYKTDKSGTILPIALDAWNHGWDSVRYGLDGFIGARGGLGVWETLF